MYCHNPYLNRYSPSSPSSNTRSSSISVSGGSDDANLGDLSLTVSRANQPSRNSVPFEEINVLSLPPSMTQQSDHHHHYHHYSAQEEAGKGGEGHTLIISGPPLSGATSTLADRFRHSLGTTILPHTNPLLCRLFICCSRRQALRIHTDLTSRCDGGVELFVSRTRIEDDYNRAVTARSAVGTLGRVYDLAVRGSLLMQHTTVIALDDVDVLLHASQERLLPLLQMLSPECRVMATVSLRNQVDRVRAMLSDILHRSNPRVEMMPRTLSLVLPRVGKHTLVARHQDNYDCVSTLSSTSDPSCFVHHIFQQQAPDRPTTFLLLSTPSEARSVCDLLTHNKHIECLRMLSGRRVCRMMGLYFASWISTGNTVVIACDATLDENVDFANVTPLSHLIVWGFPPNPETYLRRIGRIEPVEVISVIPNASLQRVSSALDAISIVFHVVGLVA